MAIKDVESKCWILALFVREDGERFLLGDGSYEFTEKQLHFAANTMANDVVEVQGNDGYLLAGQVRRPSTQTFDGYVGDSSTSKALVEERRRAFFAFFRKNFFYKVIYIFPDGSAIQRKRGFLVDAPEVKEIRQIYPEYHVALNFEDINYYYYDEDSDGQEIYGKSATINLNSVAQSGGLIWLLPSEMTLTGEGTSFTLSGTVNGTALTSAELKGDTTQQTYSGKNLIGFDSNTIPSGASYSNNSLTVTTITSSSNLEIVCLSGTIPAGSYTLSMGIEAPNGCDFYAQFYDTSGGTRLAYAGLNTTSSVSGKRSWAVNLGSNCTFVRILFYYTSRNRVPVTLSNILFESGRSATSFEPFVGGIPAPNPDYPQEVQTATGRQVVTISNGTESQEYELNLGKNLLNIQTATTSSPNMTIAINEPTVSYDINTITGTGVGLIFDVNIEAGKTYTFKASRSAGIASNNIRISNGDWDTSGSYQNISVANTFGDGATFTANSDYTKLRIWINNSNNHGVDTGSISYIQLELGSTATSYAPYFEPIELCKIGDYRDRIYKSGSDWYLHKETEKIDLYDYNSAYWYVSTSSTGSVVKTTYNSLGITNIVKPRASDVAGIGFCNFFTIVPSSPMYFGNIKVGFAISTDGLYFGNNGWSVNDFKSFISNNTVYMYYALATPTDAQITNTALIDQLDALAAATTYNGSTNFTVDGNGNLAAILAVEVEAVGGGGVEWDENGAVWEEGKPSYSIISVDSIDNVYPVLTITGRTVNPVLTDVTTGTIFQYNGTITESQVLRVDMMNKTATLNGVSVIGNVTGDWLYLAPGNNRVTYTADNADAPNATVEWQEIVG